MTLPHFFTVFDPLPPPVPPSISLPQNPNLGIPHPYPSEKTLFMDAPQTKYFFLTFKIYRIQIRRQVTYNCA